jgi:hypothetical protein
MAIVFDGSRRKSRLSFVFFSCAGGKFHSADERHFLPLAQSAKIAGWWFTVGCVKRNLLAVIATTGRGFAFH